MSVRALAKLVGTFHNVSYYVPEMKAFAEVGLPEYWRAYMAYRSAPMGIVPASVVEATFYNFAPRVVQAAIPSAWTSTSPAEVIRLRNGCIEAALHRGLDQDGSASIDLDLLVTAADCLLEAITQCEAGARPLFAAHRALPVPDEPVLRLWHACTLWREYRGDGHNLALAAAGIDGIECHVLLAAKGVGSQRIIEKIRGWDAAEWESAQNRLIKRGLLHHGGRFTDQGQSLRAAVEQHTDQLCERAIDALAPANTATVLAVLERAVERLLANQVVPGRWPPPEGPR